MRRATLAVPGFMSVWRSRTTTTLKTSHHRSLHCRSEMQMSGEDGAAAEVTIDCEPFGAVAARCTGCPSGAVLSEHVASLDGLVERVRISSSKLIFIELTSSSPADGEPCLPTTAHMIIWLGCRHRTGGSECQMVWRALRRAARAVDGRWRYIVREGPSRPH